MKFMTNKAWKKKINELEEITTETLKMKHREKNKVKKRKHSISELWDNFKCPNIYAIGALEREKRERGEEKLYEEKFPNLYTL